MTNTLKAAALSLGVDAQDLQAILPALREARSMRERNPSLTVRVEALATAYERKDGVALFALGTLGPHKPL